MYALRRQISSRNHHPSNRSAVEHMLCKHAFISPKSLNRHLFLVQNPRQVGLLIGLLKKGDIQSQFGQTNPENGLDSSEHYRKQTSEPSCSVIHLKTKAARTLERVSGPFHLVRVSPEPVALGALLTLH
jgi:hypothetical protein